MRGQRSHVPQTNCKTVRKIPSLVSHLPLKNCKHTKNLGQVFRRFTIFKGVSTYTAWNFPDSFSLKTARGPQTRKNEHLTPNSKPQTPTPRPQTRHQKPNPKPQTSNLKPQTPKSKPQTPSPESRTPHPTPRTPNPKTQTPNPKAAIKGGAGECGGARLDLERDDR